MEFRSVLAFFSWRNKWRNQQTHLCNFISRTNPYSHTVNVYCFWLLLTERQGECYVKSLTAQRIYCTNCTVCNWTVLTVITHKLLLHVQLHNRRETVKLMCSEEDCSRLFNTLCVYSLSYHKIGALSSRYWLPAQCRKLTVLWRNWMLKRKLTDTLCKLKANWSTLSVKCRFVWTRS